MDIIIFMDHFAQAMSTKWSAMRPAHVPTYHAHNGANEVSLFKNAHI